MPTENLQSGRTIEVDPEYENSRLRLAQVLVRGIYKGFTPVTEDEVRDASAIVIGHLFARDSRIRTPDDARDLLAVNIVAEFDLEEFTLAYTRFVLSTPPDKYHERRDSFLSTYKDRWSRIHDTHDTNSHGAYNSAFRVATTYTKFVETVIHAAVYGHQVPDPQTLPPGTSHLETRYGVASDIFNSYEADHSILDALIYLPNEVVAVIAEPRSIQGEILREQLMHYTADQIEALRQAQALDLSDLNHVRLVLGHMIKLMAGDFILSKLDTPLDINQIKSVIDPSILKIIEEIGQADDLFEYHLLCYPSIRQGLDYKFPARLDTETSTQDNFLTLYELLELYSLSPQVHELVGLMHGGVNGTLWRRIGLNNIKSLLEQGKAFKPDKWTDALATRRANLKSHRREAQDYQSAAGNFIKALTDMVDKYQRFSSQVNQDLYTTLNEPMVRLALLLNSDVRKDLLSIWLSYYFTGTGLGTIRSPRLLLTELLAGDTVSDTTLGQNPTYVLLTWLVGSAKINGDTAFLEEIRQLSERL